MCHLLIQNDWGFPAACVEDTPPKKNVFFASCFHDADDFFADDVSQHSSDIEHAEPDEQPSS